MSSLLSCITNTGICSVILFIFIGIPVLVSIYVLQFKDPIFSLDQTSVTGFNLTSDGRLTALFGVVMRAENPNHKRKLKYKDIRVMIYKDDQKLAADKLDSFTQRRGNVTVLRAEPIALNVSLKKGPAFDLAIERGMGYLDFGVFLDGMLNTNYNLFVSCHGRVNISSFSTINNFHAENFQSSKCSVDVYTDNND